MSRRLIAALLLFAACSPDPGGADGGGGTDAGNDAGSTTEDRYAFYGITPGDDLTDFDLAVGPDGHVGIAWYARLDTHTFGTEPDYALRYREWRAGQLSEEETIRVAQRIEGLDLLFAENGQPIVAYIGGNTPTDVSQFWHQSDAAIARRASDGTWTEEVVAELGNEATAGNPVSDRGFLVGLFPALGTDGQQLFFAWRDCHDGQFPQQDWNASDLEFAVGNAGNWQKRVVIAGGDDKQAWGGHLQMVVAEGQPAIVSDQVFGTASGPGSNLVFSRRNADGSWRQPVRPIETLGDTQSGPSLDWDPTLGFAIAVVDRTSNELFFTRSINDGVTWTEKDPVYSSGSGGWYPSLSINPVTHDPSIAYYVCSNGPGANEGNCNENDDRLVIAERIANIWRDHVVDAAGGWKPKLAHLSDGRRVVGYRNPRSGELNLAVER